MVSSNPLPPSATVLPTSITSSPLLARKQTIHCCPVDRHVFAFGHRQHEDDQHVILHLIHQPEPLPEQLDLVAVAQVTAQFGARSAWLLQAFQHNFFRIALTLPSSAFHSVIASGKNLRR